MKNMLIVDTGCWYALINDKDRHHLRVRDYISQCQRPLITTWPVITETCYLLQARRGAKAVARFMDAASRGLFTLFDLQARHLAAASALMTRYSNLPMDLADASLVILAEEIGHGDILSTDRRDFQTYRWKNHHPFKNLLFPND